MQDIMVDLETLGTVPGSVILSIGAVAFDETGVAEDGFYEVIDQLSCAEAYLITSPETKAWWERQEPQARAVLDQSLDPTQCKPLVVALARYNNFLGRYGPGSDVRIWGNGSDFDNALLVCAFDAAKVKPYWRFWNNRCYRTFKNLYDKQGELLVRGGTYHNALDDARTQAAHMVEILKAKGSMLTLA